MLIVRPNSMPRFWWLFPWSYARQLHRNCNALKALTDKQDDLLRSQSSPRPRWAILPHTCHDVTRYYFLDTDSQYPAILTPRLVQGKCLLYDGPSKSFVIETDPAKAIARVTDLNL
jgi:hypothetical protein